MAYLSSDKAEAELAQSIKKATSPEETAPKQKHIRRMFSFYCFLNHPLLLVLNPTVLIVTGCIVYTWDHRSSALIWSGLKVQPILADEVQTFKALIMVHKILKDGHPVVSSAAYVISFLRYV
jgi:hypothetical protein